MSEAMPSDLWHYGMFTGLGCFPVVSEVGDSWIATVNGHPNVVLKRNVNAKRSEEPGWWTSRERWADQVVADAEAWATTLQERLDRIDAEILALRSEREGDVTEARAAAEKARVWRLEFAAEEHRQ